MAEITGVKITDLTEAGSSEKGDYVWVTHRLGDGTEYPLVYPFEAIGYLIAVLTDVARSASRRRADSDPAEAAEGLDSNVVPVAEVRVGTAPDRSGAILHLTTADRIPLAVELPTTILAETVAQLQQLLASLDRGGRAAKRLH